jgi:hypothetical protein
MKVRFTHFEYQSLSRQLKKHTLRVTLGLTDTEHYALARLGNATTPLLRYEIDDVEFVVTIADCVAGTRLDFDTLFQVNEAKRQVLYALENLELVFQSCRSVHVETVHIPQEERNPSATARNRKTCLCVLRR